jgi:hypothetical protein
MYKTTTGNAVTEERQETGNMHFSYRSLFTLTGSPPAEVQNGGGQPISLTEDGQGVAPAYEATHVPTEHTERRTKTWAVDAGGYLVSEVETTEKWTGGAVATSQRAGAYVYGLDAGQKQYRSASAEALRVVSIKTTTYQAIAGSDSYTITSRLFEPATNHLVLAPTEQRSGARPRPEEIIPQSKSREIRQGVEDLVRSSLNGVREDVIANEYCQDDEDCMILANAELRDLSAWRIPLVMPIDHALRAEHYVTIGAGIDPELEGMRCLVESVTLNPASNTMTAALVWYPPEVADAELD